MIRSLFRSTTLCSLLFVGWTTLLPAQEPRTGPSESPGEDTAEVNDTADVGDTANVVVPDPPQKDHELDSGALAPQAGPDEESEPPLRPVAVAPDRTKTPPTPSSTVPKNVTIDGISAVAALVIAAFAVDRFATAFMFLLSILPSFRTAFPDSIDPSAGGSALPSDGEQLTKADSMTGEKINRAIYFLFAGAGALLVTFIGKIGILDVLGFKQAEAHPFFDFGLTVLILTAGADRVAALMQLSGSSLGNGTEGKPIEITGTLTIDGKKENFEATIDSETLPSE